MPEDTKECPFCAENIKTSAKKCIHCGEHLDLDQGRTGFRGKTLWDVLSLIGIPLMLAFVGYMLSSSQNQRQLAIEANRANANALQSYLDDMSTILLEKDIEDKRTITVAEARTISVLSELDGVRNGIVINFLLDTELMNRMWSVGPGVTAAELGGVDLSGADLNRANLNESILVEANLNEAYLYRADLSGANLSEADLREAILIRANLNGAILEEADLSRANLRDAKLGDAILFDADLTGAILTGAEYNDFTVWPDGINLEKAGAVLVDDQGNPIEDSE